MSSRDRRPSGIASVAGASGGATASSLTPEEEAALLATKSALFGGRTAASTTVPAGSAAGGAPSEKKESAAQEAARIRAEADASLTQLAIDLNGEDDAAGSAGGQHNSDALDLTTQDIDFDGLGGDLRAFEQHSLVQEALEKEQDLRNYSRDIDDELRAYEKACVADYIQDADQLATLHGQIKSCDGILATMESMLSHFQSDLSAISSEIQFLQEKSYGMNIKLRNYKAAEKGLNSFIQHIYIPDDLCNLILEGELNEPFVSGLIELDKKLMFLEANNTSSHQHQRQDQPFSLAARDMQPIGEKLKLKCIARIRAFLLERFHSLKKPKTNIQIKQKLLLKFAYFYQFLLHHADERAAAGGANGHAAMLHGQAGSLSALHSGASTGGSSSGGGASGGHSVATDICSEIRREYHETMSTIYYAQFKKYLAELKKLQAEPTVAKDDLLGKDDGTSGGGGSAKEGGGGMGSMLSGLSSAFSSKKASGGIDHVFTLHGREEVLLGAGDGSAASAAANERDLIIPALMTSSSIGGGAGGSGSGGGSAKLPFEKLFRSAQSLLMDTATSEYDFIVEFFGERLQRDMDRAGVFEDALALEKEQREEGERKEKERADRGGGGLPPQAALSSSSATSAQQVLRDAKKPSYSQSQSDERGREHLLPGSRDKHLFNLVFGKAIGLFLDQLESYLKFECHDALGILLLIRIVCQHNIQMQYRRVHCLDHVFDRMNMMLWPRFKSIFDDNVASVMRVPYADVKVVTRAHPIGTRYAQFASGVLHLNAGYDDDILVANLKRLRGEVDKFLTRTADRLAGKNRLVFLLNNYHAILHILTVHRHLQSEDYKAWADAADTQVAHLVEVELEETFPQVMKMVRVSGSASSGGAPAVDFATFLSVVQRFEKEWKAGIERFHQAIQRNFTQPDIDTSSGGGGGGAAGSAASGSSASKGSGGVGSAQSAAASSKQRVDHIFMRTLTQLMICCQKLITMKDQFNPEQQSQVRRFLVDQKFILMEAAKYAKA